MVKHLENLQLSVLVPFILEHFLDGYCLACFGNGRLEDNTKGTISNNFLSVVRETLLKTRNMN